MKSSWIVKTIACAGLLTSLIAAAGSAQNKEKTTAARIVVWQPKPGKDTEMEEGYKRHLGWHQKNADTWNWYGWNIISGDRDGFFVDGTFFHPWSDLDNPVSPAADGADNAQNVYPYGDFRSVASYETTPALTHMDGSGLQSPLMTFYYFDVQPSEAGKLESAAAKVLSSLPASVRCVIFRPVTGTSDYLLMVASDKTSELSDQAATARKLFDNLAHDLKTSSLISSRVETGSFRRDLSYLPSESAK